ncbi:serpentine type 7TM GPCR chemoreceptor srt domain-containing protein [Ditylenchus destructor]|uniref:Serpentine type 7TM GPCR chemoreceptor srt domain-containing protein n=1 Tax=Ditylenchus destructor TaxID=166010 RepID=A0AAD4MQ49_9BILA|nr:serpentine type 7TM GPCR chemoreceptor srt domain-containing protein [Ditylenchus destructor]
MNTYLFRPDFYASRYNCNVFSVDQWTEFGHKNPTLGICFWIIGVSTLALYIPFMAAMMQAGFRELSCYKIMFYLGVVDLGNIFVGGFVTGYLTWVGAVYCAFPNLIYINGCLGLTCWCVGCMTGCLLAFNRCIDVARPDLFVKWFSGSKTWAWLLLPTIYFWSIFMFEMPLIFDSKYVTWFYDPFVEMPVHYNYDYAHTAHSINNVAVVFILCAENAYLLRSIFKMSRASHLSSTARLKRQFIIQTIIICGLIIVASSVYVYMNYFNLPPLLTTIGTLAYTGNSGSPGFVYLFLNKNLRRAVFRMLRLDVMARWKYKTRRIASMGDSPQPLNSNVISPTPPINPGQDSLSANHH